MATVRTNPPSSAASSKSRRPPASTPEGRENQIASLAYDEVERQIRSGEASSQVLTHFLKVGSTRERLEQERLMKEVELMARKAESMESAKRVEELYEEAISAMRNYGGHEPEKSFDD
jgi:hypothetical protein